MDKQSQEAASESLAKIGEGVKASFQQAADGMAHFAEMWRASEAAEELRKFGYPIPKP